MKWNADPEFTPLNATEFLKPEVQAKWETLYPGSCATPTVKIPAMLGRFPLYKSSSFQQSLMIFFEQRGPDLLDQTRLYTTQRL